MKKFYILTLGCQMNISDSQRIATKLEEIGYKSALEKEADLVVVNACSVRQKAVDRIWGLIKKWQNGGKKILITGCVLPADKAKFRNRDIIIFDIIDLPRLDKILRKNLHTVKYVSFDYFNIKPDFEAGVYDRQVAYIPIMTGCDNFCSYCAVPYTRGREVSRPMDDIIKEFQDAIRAGFKEIWLVGQNVNSYKFGFADLLKKVDALTDDFKFNFVSSNPHDMTNAIIDTFSKLKKWTRELHLPMQAGDDEILRKMNRKYNSQQYFDLVSQLRYAISDLRLSTDIIVGFPGETKKQFENTVKLCKKIKFTKAYIGQYSPRPGTASAKMTDDVTPEEKKRRWLVLDNLINLITLT